MKLKELLAALDKLPVATILVAVITVLVGLVGGIVTVTNPDELAFTDYVTVMTGLAGANGLLGVGRGILGSSKAKTPPPGPGA
jgi:hypothetical protein